MDIIAMRNFAMDDGDPALSEEEYQQMRLAWEFLVFAITDSRSLEARVNHEFVFNVDGDTRSSKDHSLPLVTGELFDEQMEIIFQTPGFAILADAEEFPGFHLCIELFRDGYIFGTQFRDIPGTHEFEGSLRSIIWEWNNMMNGNALGIYATEPGWLDALYAHLPEWNETFNQRFEDRLAQLSEDIERFYPVPTSRP